MKIVIANGYEKAKEQIYDEALEDKKKELNETKFMSLDNPANMVVLFICFTFILYLIIFLFFLIQLE